MGGRVLVVEDNDALRQVYVRQLTEEGFEVVEAADGHAALWEFETKRPDVVVLETHMRGGDGIEVMNRMIAAKHKAAIVLNSASSSLGANYLTWVADAFITKSGDIMELVQTVHRLADAASLTA